MCIATGRSNTIAPAGRVRSFGIRFRPGGAHPFPRFPQGEIAGRILTLEPEWSKLAEHIAEAANPVGATERFLHEREYQTRPHPIVECGLHNIMEGATPVGEVARSACPKVFSRIVRFQRVLRDPGRDWARIAADYGYFDQAHLIHDFRQFTGETPASWREKQVAFLQDGM